MERNPEYKAHLLTMRRDNPDAILLAGMPKKAAASQSTRSEPLRSSEDVASNLAICHACEFYIKAADKCPKFKCGCGGKQHSRLLKVKCPEGKWS